MSDAERNLQLGRDATWIAESFAENRYQNLDVRPTQVMPVLVQGVPGLRLEPMRWGWRPAWSKQLLINARTETVATKAAWRAAYRERRCVVPATCYYEWQAGPAKRPVAKFAFRDKRGALLLLAGLWATEQGKDGPEQHFVVLTRTMVLHAQVHDRTPVMLTPDDARAWADPEAPEQEVAALLGSQRDVDLVMREVELGAEKRGAGPEVAKPVEAWPWDGKALKTTIPRSISGE
ncbi:MAG: SOS response-associated peptidase family protein [Planctomycetes bacterium]|nr:SOS response-associated peptidase family protein [Planctomycetota bacterium]